MRLTSNTRKAFTRLEPIAPAPPVTRTVFFRNASKTSSISLPFPVQGPHPVHRPSNAFLGSHLWVMLQIPDRLRAVDGLGLGREGLSVLVGDDGVIPAHGLEDEV